jgi:hypothetical protein
VVAFAALSACATVQAGAAPAETIAFETGPCFGACPVYRVTVSSDGTGSFEGRRFTAVTGARAFRATPAQYRAFARRLAPLRPARGSVRYAGEACRNTATDLPSAEVTWRSRRGMQSLYFYYGCDMERNRAIAERLNAAPRLLPIGDLIRAPR